MDRRMYVVSGSRNFDHITLVLDFTGFTSGRESPSNYSQWWPSSVSSLHGWAPRCLDVFDIRHAVYQTNITDEAK